MAQYYKKQNIRYVGQTYSFKMDKPTQTGSKKRYKRKQRKLSTTSMNLELESIREDKREEEEAPLRRKDHLPLPPQDFLKMGLPGPQPSDSEIQFPGDDEGEKDISILDREDFQKGRPFDSNLRHLLDKPAGPSQQEPRTSEQKVLVKREFEESVRSVRKEETPLEESHKYVKIYEPQAFFEEIPNNKMMLLYPFFLSKHYVDSVKQNNFFTNKIQQTPSEVSLTGFPPIKSRFESNPRGEGVSESLNENLSEAQKCRKISKKLKRAWSLNHQIAQNVFKKVTLLYKSRENSEESDFPNKSMLVENVGLLSPTLGIDRENQGDFINRKIKKDSELVESVKRLTKKRGIAKSQKLKVEEVERDTKRSLRKTTIKKKIEKEILMRQEKNKQRRNKHISWNFSENQGIPLIGGSKKVVKPNLVQDKRRLEVVEFLDYSNKNIRKKKKEDNDEEEEEY